jgi:DNA-binding transcriptional LysR family regulator
VDLRHLVTFCAVVDRGSFSAAAEDLGISQPAVSAQIRSLEERLDQRLLDRNGRRVELTEAGRVLEVHARRMIALEADLERAMGDVGERIAGRLVIGSSTGPGEVLLPRVLGAFRAAHPGVGVSLVVQDTQSICERVLEGELELGIVGAARPHRGLEFEPFLRDELVVIAPPSHPLAGRSSVTLEELAAEPLLMQQTGSGVRAVLEAALRSAGIRPQDLRIEMELGLQQSVKAAVLAGLGVTLISRLTVAAEVADGMLAAIPIEGHELTRDFSTVRASGRTPTRLTAAFVEFARAKLATKP